MINDRDFIVWKKFLNRTINILYKVWVFLVASYTQSYSPSIGIGKIAVAKS